MNSWKSAWKKEGAKLVIEQRSHPGWLFIIVGIVGALLVPVGILGILAHLSEHGFDFSQPLLIFHFLGVLGIAMVGAGIFSPAKKYRERIVFDNDREKVSLYMGKRSDAFTIPYGMVSYIHTLLEKGGPDYPDIYHLYLVKSDQSRCWVTGTSNREDFPGKAEELAEHTGFAVRDSSGLVHEKEARRDYSMGREEEGYGLSRHVLVKGTTLGTEISIKPASQGIGGLFMALVVYSFFFSVPLYLVNIFGGADIPFIVRVIMYIFCALWYAILLSVMLLSSKDYRITVTGSSLLVKMKCRFLPLVRAEAEIPSTGIRHVRTNRLADGLAMLSLGIDSSAVIRKSGPVFIMNLGVFKKVKADDEDKGIQSLMLWDIPAYTGAGKGPSITDLAVIEKTIEEQISGDVK